MVNISQTGIMLECQPENLEPGILIEMVIPWVANKGLPAMHLHAFGQIVRTDGNLAAVRIDAGAFRMA